MNLGANLVNNKAGFEIVAGFPAYRNTPIIIGECDPEDAARIMIWNYHHDVAAAAPATVRLSVK
jgi:xylan 1,4-beta-xylosidase